MQSSYLNQLCGTPFPFLTLCNEMYPSISSEFQKEPSHATSSAPPQPHFFNFEDAVATGIPVPLANQNNPDPSPPLPVNNASHSISSGPWSTSLCGCFSDLNSCEYFSCTHTYTVIMDGPCYILILYVTKSLFSKHLCGAIAW